MAAETAMAREWREHLEDARARRADMTPDPRLPGLWTPSTAPQDAPHAPQEAP